MKRYVVGMTGASGSVIGIRVLRELLQQGSEVHLLISSQCLSILKTETGIDWTGPEGGKVPGEAELNRMVRAHFETENVHCWGEKNFYAPVASGSFKTDGMLVAPCSMKTLAGIAVGYSNTLVERAADVTMKEGRRLLLSPRETPLSALHLENMLKLARLGVAMVPPMPAFYNSPGGLGDITDFVAGKVLDAFGVENSIYQRWEGEPGK